MEQQKKPTIYTVATAHLDTVWNWTFERTVEKYIPATLDDNFKLFEKYPDYVFSFEGSRRYELMEEYYPEKFEMLKKYVADGRWFVTGSAYENGDVNVPSPEALFRNILYGNGYFRDKFGKTSVDIYLPDCFGFGYALPSIIKHAGLLGFTTQKLTWSSAYGIPFDLGLWQGVDGSQIYASLDAQDYAATLKTVRQHKNAPNKLKNNIEKYDLPFTYLLHGTGDRGGAPKEESVKTVVSEKQKNAQSDTDVEIVSVDKVFRVMDEDLSAVQKKNLPVWNNELVSTDHGVGGYTSRALGKRWNRKNEQLADAAERFSVAAAWCSAGAYPQKELETAWK
ncbi:MAG: alpha-mannosidase, partial [Candidatus Fimenecus sp.]